MFCHGWTPRIRVRCAVDDGCIIHDNTEKNKTSPWVSPGHEMEQKFNTWNVHATKRVHPCGRHHVLQEDSHLCGSLAHMLALEGKNNTHRSILSDKEHESSVVSMLARAVQKNGRRITFHLAWSKHNSNFDNKVSKSTFAQPI